MHGDCHAQRAVKVALMPLVLPIGLHAHVAHVVVIWRLKETPVMLPMIDPDSLLSQAVPAKDLPAISGAGVYAICLTEPDGLAPITTGRYGLLYVGMTEQGLDARNHFHHEHSGFSTFRRSLGAILKSKLSLTAFPRSSGASDSNIKNYRFSDQGEKALSEWMNSHLVIGQTALAGDITAQEKELITLLEPPLNLTGWANPQRTLIKRLRAECAEEARRHRAQTG